MEDNRFTILSWSLPYIKWISYRCTYVPSLLTSLLPPTPSHPSRLSQRTWFELPTSYSKFPLAICFTYGNVYVFMLLSQFISLSPSPTVPTSLFSVTDSPLLLHCQKLPLYLLTWSYGFHLSVCWYGVSHWLICVYWTFQEVGVGGTYLNIIKAIFNKLTANIIPSAEKLKAFL